MDTEEIKQNFALKGAETLTQAEFLERIQRGDNKAIEALNKATQEVLGKPGKPPEQLSLADEEVRQGDAISGPFGTKSPEFTSQLTSDSQGKNYKQILQRALEILQGNMNFSSEDAYGVSQGLIDMKDAPQNHGLDTQ